MPRKNAFSLFANLSQFQMRSHIDRVNPAEVPIRDPDLTTPSLTGINCLALDDWLPMVGCPWLAPQAFLEEYDISLTAPAADVFCILTFGHPRVNQ